MIVNGVERSNVLEHKGKYSQHVDKHDEGLQIKKTWQMEALELIGYNLTNYHFYEYKEWESDFHYTVLETFGGSKVWTLNKEVHRDNDLPAVLGSNGAKVWYKRNKCHRDLGPALIDDDGLSNKQWLQNNVLHNEYGPASIVDGISLFYIRGIEIPPEDLAKYSGLERYAKINLLR